MFNNDKERIDEAKVQHMKKLNAVFHENYNVDLKSISNINNYMLDIEKSMDSVCQKIDSTIMDKELKKFFSDQYKTITRKRDDKETQKDKLEKEVKQLKSQLECFEAKKNQIVIVLQQISENFENSLIGYIGTIVQEVFCGRPEAQTPIHTM